MEENFKWLWAAFSIAWALHLGYLALLSRRTKSVENQLDDLHNQLKDQGQERPSAADL